MVTKIVRNNPTKKKIEIIRIIYTRAITRETGFLFLHSVQCFGRIQQKNLLE